MGPSLPHPSPMLPPFHKGGNRGPQGRVLIDVISLEWAPGDKLGVQKFSRKLREGNKKNLLKALIWVGSLHG